jgi:serine/threonine protein kinase
MLWIILAEIKHLTDQSDNANQPFPGGELTTISSTTGTSRTFSPGDVVDNTYQLTSLLGTGGMGIVFSCHHLVLGKDYAIKILSGEQLSKEYWNRFRAEAQTLAKLNHPGIVGIHNMGVDGGQFPYYVMDLLAGEALDLLIKREGPLSLEVALAVFIQVADALGAAHQQGIIHRDIKPSNLMLLKDAHKHTTKVKIVDFGIARLTKKGLAAQSQTKTGMIVGTPFYMSPEQCQGEKVDERSDIYSLGCTFFEALTGAKPFVGENAFHTYMMHQTKQAPRLASLAPAVVFPEAMELAMAKMLAKDLSERYQTTDQLKHDLERIKAGKSVRAHGPSTMISAEEPQAIIESVQQKRHAQDLERQKQNDADNPSHSNWPKIGIITVTIIALVGGVCTLFYFPQAPPKISEAQQRPDIAWERPVQLVDGEALVESGVGSNSTSGKLLQRKFDAYMADPNCQKTPFKRLGKRPGFQFPEDFYLLVIKIDDSTPIMASAFISLPQKDARVCVYFFASAANRPGILSKFGPADLTGLELVTRKPQEVLGIVRRWSRLDHLSFFNSLIRVPGGMEEAEEESTLTNEVLPQIDKLKDLRSLGLCGPQLTGEAILKMSLITNLDTLKLKRVSNILGLLNALRTKDNIKELWLIDEQTTNDQLLILSQMKHLETLGILRSKLTSDSLVYFKNMPALKHLCLEDQWPPDVTARFKKAFPICTFQSPYNYQYWKEFPEKNGKTQ